MCFTNSNKNIDPKSPREVVELQNQLAFNNADWQIQVVQLTATVEQMQQNNELLNDTLALEMNYTITTLFSEMTGAVERELSGKYKKQSQHTKGCKIKKAKLNLS
ncbi:unnamed protein product [Rotaria socialis]|uniref:Uncharacterized protein n=1 Tax=Rotaria socialis TaxID=392032 RepID=A0A818J8U6_9BILA|nr:unnamed protein product [Rotaria socialis]CAF3537218.1 unnamed protein product [Rotaria socialis]